MQCTIVTLSHKQPRWLLDGVQEYLKRMPTHCRVQVCELPTAQRTKSSDIKRCIKDEGERQLAVVPKDAWCIALDERGKAISTQALSTQLQRWMDSSRDVYFLIGGADGLSPLCLEQADMTLSLSAMTLPHGMARLLLAEQLYRAHTILQGHPYHRV